MSNMTIASQKVIRFYNPISFSKITKRFHEWNSRRKTIFELEQLSEDQLQDIGINRADIRILATKIASTR